MISLDWKERLKRDSQDFLERKIPAGDYDFDIIFNAYPERVGNNVPNEVIVFVASALAQVIAKKPEQYEAFLDYLWNKKGDNGKQAFVCIMKKILTRKNNDYVKQVKDMMCKSHNISDITLLLDKALLPVFKKNPAQYIDTLANMIDDNNDDLAQCLIKTILKLTKNDTTLLKNFFTRMESNWLNASQETIKINAYLLKQIAKQDKTLYFSIYDNYKNTRDPHFIEILTSGLALYSDEIKSYYENWSKSGNARIKKAALTGLKFLEKKERG
ncbi:MAG TPA: hypothetical protein PL063_06055 [Candidatus Cloacimonadota bacterium]|jgi:hypothetical protein|nr:hypothetical protein [Candidatus Cloacimonadales bacterium]HPY96758.1 hypothetical protein [Candidatus Cloacimonadota bacterium]HQB41400.1 hypothetical protein [Candidatus Cloacimonadota bacterium]